MTHSKTSIMKTKKTNSNDGDGDDDGDATTTTTTTNNNNNNNIAISLEDQLDQALASLEVNRRSSMKIFVAWRSQLYRLGIVVLVLALVMAQNPASTCLLEIKRYNQRQQRQVRIDGESEISFVNAMSYVMDDSAMELLSVLCGACLVWMLHKVPSVDTNGGNDGNDDFASTSYRLSCALLPGIVTLYYQNRHRPLGRCLPLSSQSQSQSQEEEEAVWTDPSSGSSDGHPFPVMLIFHAITSLAVWFMRHQSRRHAQGIQKVVRLKEELLLHQNHQSQSQTKKKK